MANPTAQVRWDKEEVVRDERHNFIIKNAAALVVGALASLDSSLGHVDFSADNANHVSAGIVVGSYDGDNDNLTGNAGGTHKAIVRGGFKAEYEVATSSALTDIGALVYATDGQTLTLAVGAQKNAVGRVLHWISGTTCLIYVFGYSEALDLKSPIP